MESFNIRAADAANIETMSMAYFKRGTKRAYVNETDF